MLRTILLGLFILLGATGLSRAGDAEVKAAQTTIQRQIEAFLAGKLDEAYGYAAPNIQRIYPSVEAFMGMVTRGYEPVYQPRSYTFGKVEELTSTSLMQQVLLVGPDGKNYEAVYTLELQSDGTYRITGVSLRGVPTLST